MDVYKIFSKTLNKKLEVNQSISSLYEISKISKFRKYSIAQRIRKKSLKKLLDNKMNINYNIIQQFNNLIGIEDNDICNYLNYDFNNFLSNKNLINIKIINNSQNPTKIAKDIINIYEKNNFENFSIVIHGSQANGEVTKYSDVDISVFIKNKQLIGLKDLRELYYQIGVINKKVAMFDPIGHHSVFLYLYSDLNCYPESFMPIKVLNLGSMSIKDEIIFKYKRVDLDLKIENFFNIVKIIINLINENSFNIYTLKQIISSYFMLLILEYEILFDEYKDKKTIFQNELKNYKNKSDIEVFDQASKIREQWPSLGSNVAGISSDFLENLIRQTFIMSENIQNNNIIEKLKSDYLIN